METLQRTLAIVKPDAVAKGAAGESSPRLRAMGSASSD